MKNYGRRQIKKKLKNKSRKGSGGGMSIHCGRKGTVERDALDWNTQGYQRRGHPWETWRRMVIRELEEKGKNWSEIKELARNRI
jgi:hypothetical protein